MSGYFSSFSWWLFGMINTIKVMKVLGIEGTLNLESQDVGLNLYHLALYLGQVK